MHKGFEWLKVIQGILKPVIGFYLWHTKLSWKGEWSDGCSKRRVHPVDQFLRSFNTHPLKAFIIKFFLSFIICISATICSGAVSTTDGQLVSYRSCLLRALLPSGPSRSLLSALMPSYSSLWLLGPTSLWCNCSSRLWFCLVRRSTTTARVCTCILRAIVHGSSPWLLLVAIEWVNNIKLFVWEVVIWLLLFSFPQVAPTNDAKNR